MISKAIINTKSSNNTIKWNDDNLKLLKASKKIVENKNAPYFGIR